MKTKYWVTIVIATLIVGLIIGFFIGRGKIRVETKIEYIKGDIIEIEVEVPGPSESIKPTKPTLPNKPQIEYRDSIQYIIQVTDTSEIIRQYVLNNKYDFLAFDIDTVGKLRIEQDIQYNLLQNFKTTFTPYNKVITNTIKPKFESFISTGYATNNTFIIGGGMYYRGLGLEYNYNIKTSQEPYEQDDKNYHAIKLNYKF